jgi:hypothetical protein
MVAILFVQYVCPKLSSLFPILTSWSHSESIFRKANDVVTKVMTRTTHIEFAFVSRQFCHQVPAWDAAFALEIGSHPRTLSIICAIIIALLTFSPVPRARLKLLHFC